MAPCPWFHTPGVLALVYSAPLMNRWDLKLASNPTAYRKGDRMSLPLSCCVKTCPRGKGLMATSLRQLLADRWQEAGALSPTTARI